MSNIKYRRKTICLNEETIAQLAAIRAQSNGASDSAILRAAISLFHVEVVILKTAVFGKGSPAKQL